MWVSVHSAERLLEAASMAGAGFSPARIRTAPPACLCGILQTAAASEGGFWKGHHQNMQRVSDSLFDCSSLSLLSSLSDRERVFWCCIVVASAGQWFHHGRSGISVQCAACLCFSIGFAVAMMCTLYIAELFGTISTRMIGNANVPIIFITWNSMGTV
jgi:hypothetical protein